MAAKEMKIDHWIFGEGEAGQGPEKNNGRESFRSELPSYRRQPPTALEYTEVDSATDHLPYSTALIASSYDGRFLKNSLEAGPDVDTCVSPK